MTFRTVGLECCSKVARITTVLACSVNTSVRFQVGRINLSKLGRIIATDMWTVSDYTSPTFASKHAMVTPLTSPPQLSRRSPPARAITEFFGSEIVTILMSTPWSVTLHRFRIWIWSGVGSRRDGR